MAIMIAFPQQKMKTNQENDKAPIGSNDYPPSVENESDQENDEAPYGNNNYPSSAENISEQGRCSWL